MIKSFQCCSPSGCASREDLSETSTAIAAPTATLTDADPHGAVLPTSSHPRCTVDQSRSATAARACRAQQGACFRNAFVALGAPVLARQGLLYVEGWVYDPTFGFAYHHGWNEVIQDHQPCVVDATLYRLAGLCYFPVLRLARTDAVALHEQIQRARGKRRPTLPFVVYAHDLLPAGVTLRFRQARDMAEVWGQAAPPHRELAAALSLLDA